MTAGDVIVGDCEALDASSPGSEDISLARPKSQNFHEAVIADFDIRRFQIAMNDASGVRRLQRVGDLRRNRERLFQRQWTVDNAISKRRPLHELHD